MICRMLRVGVKTVFLVKIRIQGPVWFDVDGALVNNGVASSMRLARIVAQMAGRRHLEMRDIRRRRTQQPGEIQAWKACNHHREVTFYGLIVHTNSSALYM